MLKNFINFWHTRTLVLSVYHGTLCQFVITFYYVHILMLVLHVAKVLLLMQKFKFDMIILISMRNRIVGYIIIGIGLLIGFIIWTFNHALTDIINTQCSHGDSCPMWGTLEFQTNMSIGLMIFIVLIGLYLVFFGEEEKIVTRVETKIKKVKEQINPKELSKENYTNALAKLNEEEAKVLETIIANEGSMMQSELVAKTNLSKVKITRILDKLELKELIERKRRGMTNIVNLKHK